MIKLDYGTQISSYPITLSVGTIRKPVLDDIYQLTFERFSIYETLLKLTPEIYYTEIKKDDGGIEQWEALSDEEKNEFCLFDLFEIDVRLREQFVQILDFFFVENVIYQEGFFIILNQSVEVLDETTDLNSVVRGVISRDTFPQIIEIIQQICCIHDDEDEMPDKCEFKNELARKMYEKMLSEKKKQKKERKPDKNLTIPNIISSVSARHNSLNYTNIGGLTVFQLLDTFNRLNGNSVYEIQALRVSVWGDEKKTFDSSLWYKNNYDVKAQPINV